MWYLLDMNDLLKTLLFLGSVVAVAWVLEKDIIAGIIVAIAFYVIFFGNDSYYRNS